MRQSKQDLLTVPVKPFLYQPRPAAFSLWLLLSAQTAGLLCAVFGWPLFFLISMALPLSLQQRGGLPDSFAFIYSAAQFFFFGGFIGLGQLLVIAGWVPGKKRWLLISGLVGLVFLPGAAFAAVRFGVWPVVDALHLPLLVLAGGLGGLLLGTVQAPFMDNRRRDWRVLSTLTWAVAAPLVIYEFNVLALVVMGLQR